MKNIFIVFFQDVWWFLKEPGFFIYLFIYCFFLFFFFGWFKPSDLPTSVQRLLPLPWHSVGMHLVPYDFRMSPTIQDRQTNVRLWDSRSSPDSRTIYYLPPWNWIRTSAKTTTSTSTRNWIRTSAKTAISTSTWTSMYWRADGLIIRKRLATALWRIIRFRMLGQSFWLYII